MTFDQLVYGSWYATQYALVLFRPELAIVGTILALLFVRLFSADRLIPGSYVAIIGTVAALGLAAHQKVSSGYYEDLPGTRAVAARAAQATYDKAGNVAAARGKDLEAKAWESLQRDPQQRGFFSGLLVFDSLTTYFRVFLLLFLLLVIYLTTLSGIPDREDAPDFYVLLLGSTLGMMLMTSANHLLMVFVAIEMTSVPSYALVGFLKGRRDSSEAALKYVVYGAGAAGVMLYGISLLAGLLGTAHLPEMIGALTRFGADHQSLGGDAALRTLVVALVMVMAGLAFKLSVFPFHFWTPDAFEGASAEVGGFLSVASKAAAFVILIRISLLLGGLGPTPPAMSSLFVYVGIGMGLVGAASATYGNLAAYAQNNIKRMLAYSTIAHAGYMLMAVSAMLVILNTGENIVGAQHEAAKCIAALLYYLVAYLFMNLGAFAIVALVRNQLFSEQIDDYSGLGRTAPILGVCMAVCLCSLIGIPPFGGFFGKIQIFANVVAAAHLHPAMWVVLAFGIINTVFSLFYYVRVMKTMFFGEPLPGSRTVSAPFGSDAAHYAVLTAVPVILLGTIGIEPILAMTLDVANRMF